MTYTATPYHKNPYSGGHEIYNFCWPFLGHHYHILSLSILWLGVCLFVCLELIVPLENFSLKWRRHHYRWMAANFDLCSALMAIEKWGATPTVTRGIRLLWSSPMSRLGFDHPTFKRGESSNRLRPAAVTGKLFLFQCLYILMPVQIFRQHNRYKL